MLFSRKHITKTFTLQHDQSDCGVACLLSILRLYGGEETLERLRELSGTNREGTTLLGLYQCAQALGFEAEGCEADINALITHNQPLILHVHLKEGQEHYIVCYGYQQDKFLVGDPAKGISEISPEEIEAIWQTKICLTLEPNQQFKPSKSKQKERREWFLHLIKDDIRLLVLSALLGVVIGVLGLAMAIFSQRLIDVILPSKDAVALTTGVVLLLLLLLARVGVSVLREYFLLQQSKDFNNRVNHQFYNNLLFLPKPFFDTRKIGELVARLNDTQRIQRVIRQLAGSFVIDVLVVVISIIFLFAYSWVVGLLTFIAVPMCFLIVYRHNTKIITLQREVMQQYALSESNYISSMQGISEIKLGNKQGVFSEVNQRVFDTLQNKIFDLGKVNIHLSWQSGVFSVVMLVGLLSYTSFRVLNGELQLGELMAILGVLGSLLPSVINLALVAIPINEAKVAFLRMYEFSAMQPEQGGDLPIEAIESIAVKHISFRFAGRKALFTDLSLEVKRGEIVGLMGESGCGKSTLAQLLLRFYEPENGEILVNSKHSLRSLNLERYRTLIGMVPQEIPIFNATLLENILLGSKISVEELSVFMGTYQLESYFSQFPQGLATMVGEEGINLSGGQKQILALTRALLRNPQLLILDEATSALDKETEAFVLEILRQIKPHTAILMISHRKDVLLEIADRIVILGEDRC
jgi:bacteriocin ABC transporter, ATP-binding/permease protein, putative